MAARYTSYLSPRDWAKHPSTTPRRRALAVAKAVVAVAAREEAIVAARAAARAKVLHKVPPGARTVATNIAVAERASKKAMLRKPNHKHNTYWPASYYGNAGFFCIL